jgi:hypothetical protein
MIEETVWRLDGNERKNYDGVRIAVANDYANG